MATDSCDKCGKPHPRCTAHRALLDSDGERVRNENGRAVYRTPDGEMFPCMAWPRPGLKVCIKHGGAAAQSKKAAVRNVNRQQAEKLLAAYGTKADTTPTDALLDEVRWSAGHVAWLRNRVQELDPAEIVWGQTKTEDHQATEFPGVNTVEQAVPNVWVELYSKERRHLVEVCRVAIASGIEERRIRLAESQGAMLASVIRAILDDLGLTPEQKAKVPEVVPRHLRAVS